MATYNLGERAEAYAALKLVVLGLKHEVKKCGNVYTMLKNGKVRIKTPQGVLVADKKQCNIILDDIKKGSKTYFFLGKTNKAIKSDCDVSDDGITFTKSSIKSFVGSDPTLLNASQSTRISYCIGKNAISPTTIQSIDQTKDISQKLLYIFQTNTIEFGKYKSKTFENNIKHISLQLASPLMNVLMKRYITNKRFLKDLVEPKDAEKFKDLLIHAMIGMMPTKPYTKKDGQVGLLVLVKDKVKWDVDVVDINNRKFRDKLFNAAYIETPSTTRHEFAKVYQDAQTGEYFFDLCLQIRLVKTLI